MLKLINRAALEAAKISHPTFASVLESTYKALKASDATSPEDLKAMFPSLEDFRYLPKWYVIDVGTGPLRLIAFIEFTGGKCVLKHIVMPDEYKLVAENRR